MNFRKITLCAVAMLALLSSCKKDDDGGFEPIPPRDRTLQQATDKALLLDYLNTHYYNSSAFNGPGDYSLEDIVIEELPKDPVTGEYLSVPDPANNTLLFDSEALETLNVTYLDVDYTYYILKLNQGGGKKPHFSDVLRVKYSGSLENGEVFESTANPVDIPFAQSNGDGVIEGWKVVMPQFNAASSFTINDDNTTSYSNAGVGVMFLPSGLGYYATPSAGSPIPSYANLIFKFEVLQFQVVDHENDGIPSYVEDLNENRNLFDDDTDGDLFPNAFDPDDDNDGILTIDELEHLTYVVDTNLGETEPILEAKEYERSRSTSNGVITIKTVKEVDSNGDGIPDYLDRTIAVNNNI